MRYAELLADPEKFTPDYAKRYTTQSAYSEKLSAHQAYAMANLLGLDSAKGYQKLPSEIKMHFAISSANDRHYRTKPILIAGTTGLIAFSEKPYAYSIGKNTITSRKSDSLFPLRLKAWGIDERNSGLTEMAIDLTLNQTKGYVLNGNAGLAPSAGGVGTLYYSVPNLQLKPNESWLSIDGKKIQLTRGKFWYDHQWGTGFMPSGSPRSDVLRAVSLLQEKNPLGWDWMEILFDDDTEFTLAALHKNANDAFYLQTGVNPPGIMTTDANGSYIRKNGEYVPVKGTFKVTDWVRSELSNGNYQTTHTWYPNRAELSINGDEVPEEKKHFVMVPIVKTGHEGFFAVGAEYSEGAVVIESPDGKRIGVGFLESVSYTDARRENQRLAGIPDTEEMLQLFAPQTVSKEVLAEAMTYLQQPENVVKLQKEIANCKGL